MNQPLGRVYDHEVSPILFIALDGLGTALAQRVATDMPTVSRLFEAHGVPVATPLGMPHRFWDAYHAGAEPAQITPGTPPWWAEHDALVVDMPEMPLSDDFAAQQVSGWGVDDVDPLSFRTVPAALATSVHATAGLPRVTQTEHSHTHPDNARVLTEFLVDRIEWKTCLVTAMLARDVARVDVGFHEVRTLVRAFGTQQYPEHVRRVCGALDRAVTTLSARATQLAVLAGPRMGDASNTGRFLPEIARALSRSSSAGKRSLAYRWQRWRMGTSTSVTSDGLQAADAFRRCRAQPNCESHGGIRIGVAGRDAHGRIRPGQEYRAVLDQFAAALLALRSVDDESPVVQHVLRTDDHHEGPARAEMPDLLVQWADQATSGVHCSWLEPLRWPTETCVLGARRDGGSLAAPFLHLPQPLSVAAIGSLLHR